MCVALLLSGCATLPSSGPTGSQIRKASDNPDEGLPFPIVELTSLDNLPKEAERPAVFKSTYAPPPTNLIGTGDVLDIAIYEAGVKLFGSTANLSGEAAAATQATARAERLPAYRVDDQGNIRIPFAGPVRAAGLTTSELERIISAALRGMSENPQVVVSIREAITNTIILSGEVAKPGRLFLPTNKETLSDAIALSGGYRGEAKDLAVRVQRQGHEVEVRLSDVMAGTDEDFAIYPGDRVTIAREPRSFSVMGAPGRQNQMPFAMPSVSLAEALAQAGGADPNLGDPRAVFVFRFIKAEDGTETPMVYHLNMMKAGSFFVSQRFMMHDKDLLYVGNARANEPAKFIQIISQLFTPAVLVRQLTQ